MGGRAENPFSALVELLRKQAEAAAPPAWVWGEVVSADPLSVMVGGVKLRPDQIAGAESLQGAAAGKRFPMLADAAGQHYAVIGEQRSMYPPEEHDHVKDDITDFPTSMPASDVSAWAKAETKPTYTNTEVGAAAANHAHGNITNDGKVGTAADLPLFTSTGGLVVAKTMEEAIQIWKFTNPNLLHNWDFRNPINQREASGTISTDIYFCDRWKRATANIVINSGYLALATNAELWQGIEGSGLRGETVTASVMLADGTICSGSGTFEDGSLTLTGFGTAVLDEVYDTDHSAISFKADAARNVARVKLELGTVSTLAYDPPADYGVELMKCQRFALTVDAYVFLYGYTWATATEYRCFMPTQVTMRIAPTHNIGSLRIFAGGSISITASTINQVAIRSNGLYVNATANAGLTARVSYNASFDGECLFSADL